MITVGNKYEIIDRIGEGSFGCIFKGRNKNTGKLVAIKSDKSDGIVLRNEADIYRHLSGETGFPRMRAFWVDKDGSFLVMDLLGKSLRDLCNSVPGPRPVTITALIGVQLIQRLQVMHDKGILHRDIKPENLVFGTGSERLILHLVDLGFAKRYIDNNGRHSIMEEGRKMTGTPVYASVPTHKGYSMSRRDDMESASYVLLELAHGSLPWTKDNALERKNEEIWSMFPDVPGEFLIFLKYCRSLKYNDKPNYEYLIGLFNNLRNRT